jgi:hypothetical protein
MKFPPKALRLIIGCSNAGHWFYSNRRWLDPDDRDDLLALNTNYAALCVKYPVFSRCSRSRFLSILADNCRSVRDRLRGSVRPRETATAAHPLATADAQLDRINDIPDSCASFLLRFGPVFATRPPPPTCLPSLPASWDAENEPPRLIREDILPPRKQERPRSILRRSGTSPTIPLAPCRPSFPPRPTAATAANGPPPPPPLAPQGIPSPTPPSTPPPAGGAGAQAPLDWASFLLASSALLDPAAALLLRGLADRRRGASLAERAASPPPLPRLAWPVAYDADGGCGGAVRAPAAGLLPPMFAAAAAGCGW